MKFVKTWNFIGFGFLALLTTCGGNSSTGTTPAGRSTEPEPNRLTREHALQLISQRFSPDPKYFYLAVDRPIVTSWPDGVRELRDMGYLTVEKQKIPGFFGDGSAFHLTELGKTIFTPEDGRWKFEIGRRVLGSVTGISESLPLVTVTYTWAWELSNPREVSTLLAGYGLGAGSGMYQERVVMRLYDDGWRVEGPTLALLSGFHCA